MIIPLNVLKIAPIFDKEDGWLLKLWFWLLESKKSPCLTYGEGRWLK